MLAALQIAGAHAQSEPARQGEGEPARFRYWTTSWSFRDMDLRKLTGRLTSIGLEFPVKVSGRASVDFDVSVPLDALKNPKAYKFRGSISSPRLTADQLVLEGFSARVDYSDGVLRLTQLRGKQADGSFEGSATADIASKGPFDASLKIRQLRLGPLAELLLKLGIGQEDKLATGLMDGDVHVSGTLSKWNDIASWAVAGELHLHQLQVGESTTYSITMPQAVLRDGRLSVPHVGVKSSAPPDFYLQAHADVQLTGSQMFTIALQADDIPMTDLVGMYFDSPASLLRGKLDLQGTATGELHPADNPSPTLDVQLALASPSIQVFGFDLGLLEHRLSLTSDAISLQPLYAADGTHPLKVGQMKAEYRIQPQRFKVTNLVANLFGGTIHGNAELSRVSSGEHRIVVDWNDLEPKLRLPAGLASKPVCFSAATSGNLDWSLPADKVEFPALHRANVKIQTNTLRLGSTSVGSLDVGVQINESELDIRGHGQLFAGRVELKSTSQLDSTVRWTDLPEQITAGQLRLDDVSVGEMVEGLAQTNRRRFAGRISGGTDLTIRRKTGLETRSHWIIRDLGVDRCLLSRRLEADVATVGSQINIRSISGSYADGQLRVAGSWSLSDGSRILEARIVRADGDRLLLPLSSSADRWARGKVSGRATIVGYGQQPLGDVRISGTGRLTDGRSFGIPVGNARAPFRILVKRKPLSWQANFTGVRSELAHGQVHGDLRFSSAGASRRGFDMDSRWRLHHVDLEQLLRMYVGTKTVGRGVVTGQIGLSGRRIRSLDALQGGFRVTLGGTDVTAVPGLSATSSLLGMASLVGTRFDEGEAAGRISGGGVGIDQLVLLSDRLKVISSGRVGLKDGRLDMMTIATTGNFRGQNRVLEGIAPNALVSFSPVASLNQLVSNRTVVVDTVGTLRDPQIRLRPAETLQANLSELVIRQLVGQLAIESDLLEIDW